MKNLHVLLLAAGLFGFAAGCMNSPPPPENQSPPQHDESNQAEPGKKGDKETAAPRDADKEPAAEAADKAELQAKIQRIKEGLRLLGSEEARKLTREQRREKFDEVRRDLETLPSRERQEIQDELLSRRPQQREGRQDRVPRTPAEEEAIEQRRKEWAARRLANGGRGAGGRGGAGGGRGGPGGGGPANNDALAAKWELVKTDNPKGFARGTVLEMGTQERGKDGPLTIHATIDGKPVTLSGSYYLTPAEDQVVLRYKEGDRSIDKIWRILKLTDSELLIKDENSEQETFKKK